MCQLYKKTENYLNFVIEIWYRESAENWFYEIRKDGSFVKANWYGLISSGAAIKTAKEFIDAQIKFVD